MSTGQWLAGLDPEAVHQIDHARRNEIGDQFHEHKDYFGCLLRRLLHHAISRGERRRELPGSHQNRKVPESDLAAKLSGSRIHIETLLASRPEMSPESARITAAI